MVHVGVHLTPPRFSGDGRLNSLEAHLTLDHPVMGITISSTSYYQAPIPPYPLGSLLLLIPSMKPSLRRMCLPPPRETPYVCTSLHLIFFRPLRWGQYFSVLTHIGFWSVSWSILAGVVCLVSLSHESPLLHAYL